MKKRLPKASLILLSLLLISGRTKAQLSITSLPYSPAVVHFNNYNPNTQVNALATIPPGWSFSCTGAPAFNGQTILPTTIGGYWGFSTLLFADINLGALRNNGTGDITYQVSYVNNTGGTITNLVISWDYEQWCFANTSGWNCYGTGALAGNTLLDSKDYTGVNFSLLNLAVITPVPTFTLSGLSIPNGASFGIAWTTTDDSGADNGVAIDNFAITASAVPAITISDALIPPGNIYQTSQNNVLYRTTVQVAVGPSTLNSVVFSTGGNYLSSNLSNLKLWYSTQGIFSAGTATLLSTLSSGLGPGAKTFSGLSQRFSPGTGYLFLTTDVPCNTSIGNAIHVNAINTSNLTFSIGHKSGAGFSTGGAQTISAMSISPVLSQTLCAGKATQAITFSVLPASASVSWRNNNTNTGLGATGTGNIPSYTSPLVSSTQSALITATVTGGACTGSQTSFSLVVKNNGQSSSAWTGAVSTDWQDADNWTNCACSAHTDATITASGFHPLIVSDAHVRNLTLNPNTVLSVQSTEAIHVKGNWTNNGIFNAQQGAVVFDGSSGQTIGGNSPTGFYDLLLNNVSGASLASSQQIRGTLLLHKGNLHTNNQLTLAASGNQSGKIGPIDPGADITGQVTVQQIAPGGATGWALIGSPISSPLSMADWNDDFPITCISCPNGYNQFTSVYSYQESIPGEFGDPAKYIPIASITDPIKQGAGYWVYLGNGTFTTTSILFDVSGTVAKSSCLTCTAPVTIPLSYTQNNGVLDDGWNLISNPLPSPISWTALRNENEHVDNAIYVYNTDLNKGAGGYASYINGVSSPSGGNLGDDIAIGQGFYVHATAPATLVAGEDIKTDSNPVFLRSAKPQPKPTIRLALANHNADDETVFYFDNGDPSSFQPAFDAYKLVYDPGLPYLGSMSDTILTGIKGLPGLSANISLPVKAMVPGNGSYTFSASQSDFPDDVCVSLYDTYTGLQTDILTSSYVCTLYDTTSVARFRMRFFTMPLPLSSRVKPASCKAPAGAVISASPSGKGPWNYEWKSNGVVVRTRSGISGADSLEQLSGGLYSVRVSLSGGQCEHSSESFSLNPVIVPQAAFVPDVSVTSLSGRGQIHFQNTSSQALISLWDFGDQSGSWYIPQPSYEYQQAGTYTVTLVTESKSHCRDTTRQVIQVLDDLTGNTSLMPGRELRLASLSEGRYQLLFRQDSSAEVRLDIFDLKGALLFSETLREVSSLDHPVDLGSLAPGLYLLQVSTGSSVKTFRLNR
jgi:hypothetical protein